MSYDWCLIGFNATAGKLIGHCIAIQWFTIHSRSFVIYVTHLLDEEYTAISDKVNGPAWKQAQLMHSINTIFTNEGQQYW